MEHLGVPQRPHQEAALAGGRASKQGSSPTFSQKQLCSSVMHPAPPGRSPFEGFHDRRKTVSKEGKIRRERGGRFENHTQISSAQT